MLGKLLIIEDDRELADLLKMHMQDLGFEVLMVHDGDEGLEKAREGDYSFMILDITLPGMLGFDVCQRLRAAGVRTPIMMLSSRKEEIDKVVALETGADDYMTKPFSFRELQARVRAILRRVEGAGSHDEQEEQESANRILHSGDLRVDVARKKVFVDDTPVDLTAREFDLLEHFIRHPGHVFSRQKLLESVWGYGYEGYEHTVNTTMNRLRNKIETEPASPQYIVTVRGLGYKLAEPEERHEKEQ